jgi:hypothetical protein
LNRLRIVSLRPGDFERPGFEVDHTMVFPMVLFVLGPFKGRVLRAICRPHSRQVLWPRDFTVSSRVYRLGWFLLHPRVVQT